MVQVQTVVKISDNSGGRVGQCIRIVNKSRSTVANVGDLITVAIKKSRPGRKVQKKDVCTGIILRTKYGVKQKNGLKVRFEDNACALLTNRKDKTPIGTRIFGPIPVRELRDKGFMKCVLLARSII